MPATGSYTGRFAPSPTGPLHIGSLTCALASFLDARAAGGRWLVRIEDLDPPREQPGAAADILRSLEQHGLAWDGDVVFQSTRGELYAAALEQLAAGGHAFRCPLSRAQLDAFGGRHPGRAASEQVAVEGDDFAWRLNVPDRDITFVDRIRGLQACNLARQEGPFVVRRRDGLFAYQLAVVVDDHAQGITDVVRGSDLLDSTPRQLWLLECLGLPAPRYAHIPVLVDADGNKLSKQDRATPVNAGNRLPNLRLALAALGQDVPPDAATPEELLAAAIAGWRPARIPRQASVPLAQLTAARR
ncbi:MAG: tRNA glutamyl-Q(34) synthetase GluQRS [Pseudomonadota bacterium]